MSDKAVVRDMVFLGVAVVLHGTLFAVDPGVRWGAMSAQEKVIPIEFVQAPTSPFLAPIPPGDGKGDEMPDNGPGPVVIPKTSHPETKAKPQLSVPKPEEPKPEVKTAQREPSPPKVKTPAPKVRTPKPRPAPAAKPGPLRERRTTALRGPGALAPGPTPAQLARMAARQRKLDLSRELAQLKGPDESVSDASDAPSVAGAAQRSAASLEQGPSAASDPDLRDSLNSAPMGGGVKRTEGSMSWSIDGPIGTRRLLKRVLPVSPDWVSQRGLDLTVQVKFQVLEDGSVKPGAIIKVTSGFPELDRIALDAIRVWKFEAVPRQAASAPQTWGVVTFRFTMG